MEQRIPYRSGPRLAVGLDLSWLTWERAILAVTLIVGIGLRFYRLDLQPLSTLEAGYAWSAWRLAEGLDSVWPGANPLFLSLQSALFWLTGGSDFGARIWSALAGVGCIVVVAGWKTWLGRGPALLLAVFVALAPWQVTLSRQGDGSAITFFLGLLAITLLQQRLFNRYAAQLEAPLAAQNVQVHGAQPAQAPPKESGGLGIGPDIWKIALALGLLIISGPVAWMFGVLLLLWWAAERAHFAAALQDWRGGVRVFLVALLLGSTGWLSRIEGLGDLSGSLSVWLSRFGMGGENGELSILYHSAAGGDLRWVFWRILADQPLLTLVGCIGLVAAWRGAARVRFAPWLGIRFLTLWFLIGMIWLLLPGRDLATLAFFGIPVLAGAAWFIAGVLSRIPMEMDSLEAGSVGVTLVILAVAGWIWMTGLSASLVLDLILVQALLAILGLLILLIVLYAYWAGWDAAQWVTMCLLLALVLAGAARTAWAANLWNPHVAPNGHAISATHRSVRQMVTDLETLSAQRTGDPHKMFVFLEPGMLHSAAFNLTATRETTGMRETTDPVLAWYLRDFPNITWPARARLAAPNEPVAYVRALPRGASGGDQSAQGEGMYAETYYDLRTFWLPGVPAIQAMEPMTLQDRVQMAWGGTWRPVFRWLLYREPPTQPESQHVRLRLMFGEGQ